MSIIISADGLSAKHREQKCTVYQVIAVCAILNIPAMGEKQEAIPLDDMYNSTINLCVQHLSS